MTSIALVTVGILVGVAVDNPAHNATVKPSYPPASMIAQPAGESAGEFASTAAAILATPDAFKRCVRALDRVYVAVELCEPLLTKDDQP
jgi:hypothetical protein